MRPRTALPVLGVTLAMTGACSDERVPAAPPAGPALQAGASRGARAPRPMPGEEYLFQVEHEVPGFGGMYYDDAGDLVIALRDLRLSEAAAAAVRPHLPGLGKYGLPDGPHAAIRFRRADYSFSELNGYWQRLNQVVFEIPGVVSTDVDEEINRVVVRVQPSVAREVLAATAALGLPEGSVQVRTVEPCAGADPNRPPPGE